MRKLSLLSIALLLAGVVLIPASHAQDDIRLNVPEGALARLGKGIIGWGDRAVAYSPDGTRLAVASSLGIRLYDAHTGTELALLQGHKLVVNSVAFAPDGTHAGQW